ncbi:MAG: hypothetical protein J1E31_04880 [Helicobacter sp.]|nr:hypothetical protein [Helicobacter sp.]
MFMGFFKEDYEIIEFLLERNYLNKGFEVVECGSQDLVENREGQRVLDSKNRQSTKSIYESYGSKSYCCMDLEGYHNAFKFDLGKDLKQEYGFCKTFDLVTCKDIGHWIFDQKQLFTNLHNLCKKGGIIVWRSPIGGGFAQGCFAYHHYKILQLAFANNYLLLGGYITEYLHGTISGKFDSLDRKTAEKIKMRNGGDFIDAVEEYIGREGSWRYLPLTQGLPSVSPTLMFLKQDDKPFIPPLFYFAPPEETIKRNAKSVLQNCFPKVKSNKIAIFGSERAGKIAKIFAQECDLEIVCFIDDFKEGKVENIPVIRYDSFISDNMQQDLDFILIGPHQSGGGLLV